MIKRTFDIIVSTICLLIGLPFLVITAILIRLESPGPIIVRKIRAGQNLKRFTLLKFRTMHVDAQTGKPALTKTGRFLRRFRLDNFLQLINILKGDMSFVGPHPELPSLAERFRDSFAMLLRHRPGLTDLATLKFLEAPLRLRSRPDADEFFQKTVLPEKIWLSSFYLRRASLLLDFAILCETLLRLCGSRYSFFIMPGESRKKPLGPSKTFSLEQYPHLPTPPMKNNLWFLQGNGFSGMKLLIDLTCGALSFALAFGVSIIINHWYDPAITLNRNTLMTEVAGASFRGCIFVLVWLSTLAALGLYARKTRNAYRWKPLKILLAIFSAPALWYAIPFQQLPPHYAAASQGTAFLLPFFLGFLIGGPRLAKHFILDRMVIEIHHHRKEQVKTVLVIGGAGYIGSQLCRDLLDKGYKVRILDTFLFGEFSVRDLYSNPDFDVMVGDFRNIEAVIKAVHGVDAVVHLGGLVGDPACALDDDQTLEINLTATMMVAEICKALKIERLIFASSCSVYGAGEKEVLTESSSLNPVSLYARTKIASEQVLVDLANEEFAPTILRFSTLFGLSPRPRFDLVVNLLTAQAVKDGRITVSGGSQWRPFVHVKDVSKTIITVLESPLNKVRREIFNVGSDGNNFTIMDVANKIAALVPGTKIEIRQDVTDRRDYNVSFKKLRETLGLDLSIGLDEGILEIKNAFTNGTLRDYSSTKYSNLKQTQKAFHDFQVPAAKPTTSNGLTAHSIEGHLRKTARAILGETSKPV